MYELYSDIKKSILHHVFESSKIRQQGILITGKHGVGKSILALTITKHYFDTTFNQLFYEKGFCYVPKLFPYNEMNFLLKQVENHKNSILYEKLRFHAIRILSTLIYEIPEINDKILLKNDSSLLQDAASFFNELRNNKDKQSIINASNFLIENKSIFNDDFYYLSEIHRIQRWISNTYSFDKRIILLENIHLMGNEASNAFLKTLEEPPENLFIIMTSASKKSVAPTIVSRCSVYDIERCSYEEMKTIISNEIDQSLLSFIDDTIESFEEFYTIVSTINHAVNLDNAKHFIELCFLQRDNFSQIMEIISSQNNKYDFLHDCIHFLESNLMLNKSFLFSETISRLEYQRMLSMLNKIMILYEKYNYSIDNALVFLYLNREKVILGEVNGEAFVL